MFWFAEAAEAAHGAAEHAEEAEHHSPIIVDLVNHYFGEYAYRFEMAYTKPKWDAFLGYFGTTAEDAFGKIHPRERNPLVHGDVCHRLHFERSHYLDPQGQAF